MITIAETKDHELIATLNEEVQVLHHDLHPDIFKPYDQIAARLFFKDFMAKDNCHAYVALQNNEAIGYAIFIISGAAENAFKYASCALYIDQIVVLERHRLTGAGKLLLEQAEHLAKELSIDKIELDHWSANVVAAAYFRRRGYVVCKERLWKLIN